MLDWCRTIESKLEYLGILHTGDNDYTDVPWDPRQSRLKQAREQARQASSPSHTSTGGRDPSSPLPPPPTSSPRPPLPPLRRRLPSPEAHRHTNPTTCLVDDDVDITPPTTEAPPVPSHSLPASPSHRSSVEASETHSSLLPPPYSETEESEEQNSVNESQEHQLEVPLENSEPQWIPADDMATGNLIELGDDLDQQQDEEQDDVYEPMWDNTRVTRNPQDVYSVPRPHGNRDSTAPTANAGMEQNGAASGAQVNPPPILPPKSTRRSLSSPAHSGAAPAPLLPPPNASPRRSPVHQRSIDHVPASPVSPPIGQGGQAFLPMPILPAYSPRAPGPEVIIGAEASMDMSLLSPKMREAMGFGDGNNDAVCGWNAPPPASMDAPPPYLPKGALECGANKSLKFTQVQKLEREMQNEGGVKVMLRKIDCYLTVAFVDVESKVWIGGWNQQARPFLHNAFHIGDQLISINGQVVENARMAFKLIKHCDDSTKISFIIKRVPLARVFAMKRSFDGEQLGIHREGSTAEIAYIDPAGLAGQTGVPQKATTMNGDNFCNWWITEVNNRALNLFFKDNEIEPRLNAVGKDITIMVQPSDFVKELKKQLKGMKKIPYKDFLLN